MFINLSDIKDLWFTYHLKSLCIVLVPFISVNHVSCCNLARRVSCKVQCFSELKGQSKMGPELNIWLRGFKYMVSVTATFGLCLFKN